MATPSWDILHTRFASSIRDSVASASTNGKELLVADRDAYLNYSYSQYVRLVAMYNPDAIDRILPDLFTILSVVAAGGLITLPLDFGYYVDLSQLGSDITKLEAREFLDVKNSVTQQATPSATNIYVSINGTNVLMIPTTTAGTFDLSYITSAQNIVEGGSVDIALRSEHWDTIVSLAKVAYYRDKQEFEIANSFLQDAIINSPFKIGEVKR